MPAGATARRCVVLLGLPGAGKSSAGQLAATRLGWAFTDLDTEIERAARMPVAEIFAKEGESGFRVRETEATRAVAAMAARGERLLLAPGGGWIEDPQNLGLLGPGIVSVYLRVSPLIAVGRMGEAAEARPLIAGARTADHLKHLLRRRESLYLQANHTVNVDSMSLEQVADSIVALASGSDPD